MGIFAVAALRANVDYNRQYVIDSKLKRPEWVVVRLDHGRPGFIDLAYQVKFTGNATSENERLPETGNELWLRVEGTVEFLDVQGRWKTEF